MSRRSIKFILAALLAAIIAFFGFGVSASNAGITTTYVDVYRASDDVANTFPNSAQGNYNWSNVTIMVNSVGFVDNPPSGAFNFRATAPGSKSSTIAADLEANFTAPSGPVWSVSGYAKQLTVANNRDLEDIKLQGTLDTFSSYNPSRLATVSQTGAAAISDACLAYFGYDNFVETQYPEAKIMAKTAILIAKNRNWLSTAQKTACGW